MLKMYSFMFWPIFIYIYIVTAIKTINIFTPKSFLMPLIILISHASLSLPLNHGSTFYHFRICLEFYLNGLMVCVVLLGWRRGSNFSQVCWDSSILFVPTVHVFLFWVVFHCTDVLNLPYDTAIPFPGFTQENWKHMSIQRPGQEYK